MRVQVVQADYAVCSGHGCQFGSNCNEAGATAPDSETRLLVSLMMPNCSTGFLLLSCLMVFSSVAAGDATSLQDQPWAHNRIGRGSVGRTACLYIRAIIAQAIDAQGAIRAADMELVACEVRMRRAI